jgi:hypothetical protein
VTAGVDSAPVRALSWWYVVQFPQVALPEAGAQVAVPEGDGPREEGDGD